MGSESHESQALKLPVLDFTKENLKPGTESWLLACKNVRKALEDYGCFIVEYDNSHQTIARQSFLPWKNCLTSPQKQK
ncbi:hypothetical protein SLA2020_437290 [Shorea laevis]